MGCLKISNIFDKLEIVLNCVSECSDCCLALRVTRLETQGGCLAKATGFVFRVFLSLLVVFNSDFC